MLEKKLPVAARLGSIATCCRELSDKLISDTQEEGRLLRAMTVAKGVSATTLTGDERVKFVGRVKGIAETVPIVEELMLFDVLVRKAVTITAYNGSTHPIPSEIGPLTVTLIERMKVLEEITPKMPSAASELEWQYRQFLTALRKSLEGIRDDLGAASPTVTPAAPAEAAKAAGDPVTGFTEDSAKSKHLVTLGGRTAKSAAKSIDPTDFVAGRY